MSVCLANTLICLSFKLLKTPQLLRLHPLVVLFQPQEEFCDKVNVATLLRGECEDETHTPGMGTWESAGTFKTSKLDCRGQNTLHWGVLYIIGKLLKLRCRKWARTSHLDICSTSYGKKKGHESNWQFDSRPIKVKNRPEPGACRCSATHHWKAIDKSYKFALDLIPVGGLNKEL
jgi:hypothetical protein